MCKISRHVSHVVKHLATVSKQHDTVSSNKRGWEVHRKKAKVLFNVTHDVKLVQKAAKLLRFIAVPLRFFSHYWRVSLMSQLVWPVSGPFWGLKLCPWQHSESCSELGQTRTSSSVNKKSPDLTKLQLVPARALLPHASLALVCFFSPFFLLLLYSLFHFPTRPFIHMHAHTYARCSRSVAEFLACKKQSRAFNYATSF